MDFIGNVLMVMSYFKTHKFYALITDAKYEQYYTIGTPNIYAERVYVKAR